MSQKQMFSCCCIFEPVSSIRYKLVCAYSEDSNQSVHPHSVISLSFLHEQMLDPWLSTERLFKTLIRLCGCAGCSESSMGAHDNVYLLLDTYSNNIQLDCSPLPCALPTFWSCYCSSQVLYIHVQWRWKHLGQNSARRRLATV